VWNKFGAVMELSTVIIACIIPVAWMAIAIRFSDPL
jgi:hypothetical protein